MDPNLGAQPHLSTDDTAALRAAESLPYSIATDLRYRPRSLGGAMRGLATLATLAVLSAVPAHADRGARADDSSMSEPTEPPPLDRFWYNSAVFARVNPLGLINVNRFGWRRRLSTSDSVLWNDTYTFLGGSAVITPAWARAGVYAEVAPIALFRASADVGVTGYYGTFDQVLSFEDPGARYSDRTISDLSDRAAPRAGWYANFSHTIQAKAGPIAVRSITQYTMINLGLPDDDAYFYDQMWDRLAPNGRFMILNDLDTLFVAGKKRIGLRYTFSHNLAGGDRDTDGGMSHNRLGPLFAMQLSDKPVGSKFNQATFFALAQFWLTHPYRTGDEQSQFLPLIAVGIAFNGDLARVPNMPVTPP
jgi:hypothetical protein